ncbi:hypothetical protein OG809_33995 [Kribbella soli]
MPYTDHLRIYDTRGQIAAYTTVLAMTDFPEELETPGAGQWLRTLSEIKAIDDDGEAWSGAVRRGCWFCSW